MKLQGKMADFSVMHSVEATLTLITLIIQYYYLNKCWKITNRIIHSNTNLVYTIQLCTALKNQIHDIILLVGG